MVVNHQIFGVTALLVTNGFISFVTHCTSDSVQNCHNFCDKSESKIEKLADTDGTFLGERE